MQAKIELPKNVRGEQGRGSRFQGAETENTLQKSKGPIPEVQAGNRTALKLVTAAAA